MTSLRAVWPGFIGLVLLVFGVTSLASGIQSGDAQVFADHVRSSSIPNGLGLAMVLGAFAIGRRTRLGFAMGAAIGVLMLAAGVGLIALEIGYLRQGGESAAFAGLLIPVFAVWSLAWLIYTWRLWAGRSSFAPTMGPADRRLATVVAAVVAVGAAAWFGAGAFAAAAAGDAIKTDEQARATVEASAFAVRVVDASINPATSSGPATVGQLTIELELGSQEPYDLAATPALCLTSLAWFQRPEYKPGTLCWGKSGTEESMRSAFATLAVPADTKVTLHLDGTGSPCAFPPGTWNAELALAPVLGGGSGDVGPAPMLYSINTTFVVDGGAVAAPPSGTADGLGGCLGVSP